MNLDNGNDNGQDLKIGDIVWIKSVVVEKLNEVGDVKVRYFARPKFDEYARVNVNAIFLRRSKFNWIRRLFIKYYKNRGNSNDIRTR